MFKLAGLIAASAVISACDSDFNNPVGDKTFSSGDADFTTFVAVGDSLTAGYADGALYLSGQTNSYPNILAQQFAKVGGGSFNQPLVADNLGGLLFGGNPDPDTNPSTFGNRLVLNADATLPRPVPEPVAGTPTTEVFSLQTGTFNNMGVPGAKSFHLTLTDYGNRTGLDVDPATANPYYVRFAPTTSTPIIAAAAGQVPSFFIMWIGNNDVLSYATGGGVATTTVEPIIPPYGTGTDDITDPAVFQATYDGLVGAMTANPAARGVLVNIPDVATIPYFTTVAYNPVPLDQANADKLNTAYTAYNGGVQAAFDAMLIDANELALRTITFAPGLNNAVVITTDDNDLTDLTGLTLPYLRQANANDLLVLTAGSIIGTEAIPGDETTAWGLGTPLQDSHVLIPSEIAAVDTARLAFNATIQAAADANANLILVDAAALMAGINDTGFDYGTGFVDSTYATGGAFSLDGVHPTARGYAIVANAIIDAINTGFNANVAKVDPGAYTTIFVK